MKSLKGRVAVVAGATRGVGRGIACMLGEAGATVYCTGRSTRENRPPSRPKNASPFDMANRPETIEETAEMVSARGGTGIHAQVDHTVEEEVAKKNASFIESETPFFVGRAVAALAADPKVLRKSGKVLSSWNLAREYGFKDVDGRIPDIAGWVQENMAGFLEKVRESERRFCNVGSIFSTPQ